MKLPWDRNYFKICFYGILLFAGCYLCKTVIDGAASGFADISGIFDGFKLILKDIGKLLSPLLIGILLALILDPVVNYMQKKRSYLFKKYPDIKYLAPDDKKRTLETAVTYIIIISAIAAVSYAVINKSSDIDINVIKSQLSDMFILIWLKLIEWGVWEYIESYADYIYKYFSSGGNLVDNIAKTLSAAGSTAFSFIIGSVLAFYFLQRKKSILKALDKYSAFVLSPKIKRNTELFLTDFYRIFSKYMTGQMIDACIMAVLISLGLSAIGVDFAVLIGVLTGFTNLIPYLGAVTGFILSVIMAFVTGPPVRALYAAIFVLVLQQVDSAVIIPKVVGEKVKLSPPIVILSIVLFGKLFGIAGMVLAVPVTSLIKLKLDRMIASEDTVMPL